MGSPFDAAARAANAVQVRVFGEPVRIEPQAGRQIRLGGTIANGTRPMRTVRGIFTKASASAPLEGSRRGADGRGTTAFAGFETMLALSAEVYASLGYDLKDGDAIVLTDRADERWTIVKAGPPDDLGDITLVLSMDGSAP